MANTIEALKDQLSQLPQKQRAELAHFLLHTLDNGEDADAEAAWDAELDRRAAEIKSGKDVCEPVEKVKAELPEKIRTVKLFQIHRLARAEWDQAIAYYEKQQAGLGLDLQTEVEDVFDRIQQNPGIGAPYKLSEYRTLLVHRFPYAVIYLETEDAISVMAIAHQRRRPGYWSRRRIP